MGTGDEGRGTAWKGRGGKERREHKQEGKGRWVAGLWHGARALDSSGSQGWDCSRIPVGETREPNSGHTTGAFEFVIPSAHTHIRGKEGPVMNFHLSSGRCLSATEKKPLLLSLPFSHAGQEPCIFLAVKALCVSWQHKFLELSPFLSQRAEVESLQALLAVGCLLKPHAWRGGFASHAEGFLLPTCPPEVNSSLDTQQHRLHPVPACFFFLLHHQWGLATHSMDSQSAWDLGDS